MQKIDEQSDSNFKAPLAGNAKEIDDQESKFFDSHNRTLPMQSSEILHQCFHPYIEGNSFKKSEG